LEAADIPVLLRYDSISTVYGATFARGVEVRVPEGLAERARDVLAGD
jgi:hypothetical protein